VRVAVRRQRVKNNGLDNMTIKIVNLDRRRVVHVAESRSDNIFMTLNSMHITSA
jgi:hypothetical protein